jgi:hypothetical protein
LIPGNRKRIKRGEKHHWWPKGISKFWENENGKIHRIEPTGKVVLSNPKEFAHISNGHNFLYDKPSSWEETIEHYFDTPDQNMGNVIQDLKGFREWNYFEKRYIYAVQEEDGDNIDLLRECILSLIVRSPMYRNTLNNLVLGFRGELEKSESKLLIASNLGTAYRELINNSKGCGRLAVLFSDDAEFIYGDGIYSNISTSLHYLTDLRVVIPLTPNIAVVWSNPMSHSAKPHIMATSVDALTVSMINDATQVYSKDYLFYRSEKPKIIETFALQEHRVFAERKNSLFEFVNSLIKDNSDREHMFSWI